MEEEVRGVEVREDLREAAGAGAGAGAGAWMGSLGLCLR